MITKLFDPHGKLTLRFGLPDARIAKWLRASGFTVETAEPYATYVEDGALGTAIEYPARLEQLNLLTVNEED